MNGTRNGTTLGRFSTCLLACTALVIVAGSASAQDSPGPSFGKVLGVDAATSDASGPSSDGMEIGHASEEQLASYDKWFKENKDRHLKEVQDFVAMPTRAMDPGDAESLIRASEWLTAKLEAVGMENATVFPSDGLPIVTAEWMGAEGKPTVLFYGHFDVQPVDESKWDTPPFAGEIKDGKLFGRGATDDKGSIIQLISAIEAILELDGSLPVNVKLLLDGAEEFGSGSMPGWLADNADWVKQADYGFNADAMMHSDDQGLMWRGLRGGSDVEVTLTSANTVLHSGIYGGAAPNAAIAASEIIASMFNDDGTVAIEGFYDGITELSEEQRAEIADAVAGVDEAAARERLGIAEWIGDKDYTIVERTWIWSSLDVTGFKSGYLEGKASLIPDTAWFRVMARLAAGQDPEAVNDLIEKHVQDHTPHGLKVEVTSDTFGPGIMMSSDDLNFAIAKTVMTEIFGKEPYVLYVGGGVPAVAYVPDAGGPKLITFGFQRSDENFHAPNEYMRIASFELGQRAYARLLHAVENQPLKEQ
ncbi:MAG: M20 family dipeptidase [bacterium]|nr:M20 family dipeptidase [bacterium]